MCTISPLAGRWNGTLPKFATDHHVFQAAISNFYIIFASMHSFYYGRMVERVAEKLQSIYNRYNVFCLGRELN